MELASQTLLHGRNSRNTLSLGVLGMSPVSRLSSSPGSAVDELSELELELECHYRMFVGFLLLNFIVLEFLSATSCSFGQRKMVLAQKINQSLDIKEEYPKGFGTESEQFSSIINSSPFYVK
ncbi:Udp-Glucuronosyltransferase 1-6 [Manis pentadactyla]|nr:Udp-Glucuronosyltransferase 1-6 [Manis pentadactyla]